MNLILNSISVISAFLFGVGCIYLLLDATLGKLKLIHSKFEWLGLQVKDFVFLGFAAFSIIYFTDFILPF